MCSITPGSPAPKAQCAQEAAVRAVKARAGDGSITCTQGPTLLRWTCAHSNGTTYRVVFSVKSRRWFVSVTP